MQELHSVRLTEIFNMDLSILDLDFRFWCDICVKIILYVKTTFNHLNVTFAYEAIIQCSEPDNLIILFY